MSFKILVTSGAIADYASVGALIQELSVEPLLVDRSYESDATVALV